MRAATRFVPANHPDIQYQGRWDQAMSCIQDMHGPVFILSFDLQEHLLEYAWQIL